MTGKELNKIVRNSGIKAVDIIEKSGINKDTYYSLYKKKEVELHYLEKIEACGVKIKDSSLSKEVIGGETNNNKYMTTNPLTQDQLSMLIDENNRLVKMFTTMYERGELRVYGGSSDLSKEASG